MISNNNLWKELKMENLGQIVSGGTPKTDMPNFWDGNISWITPTDVTALKGKKYISSTKRKISDEGLKNSSANMLPINTLIVCTRATIGDSVINKFPISTNQGFKSLITKPDVSSEYMYYWVSNNKKELIQQSSGSTFLELSTKSFKNLSVLLPPLPEQQKIAEILSTVDDKIEVIDQQITETQELKKGLMQRLLTKGIGHTEFKDSTLGMIPESWEVVELDEISSTTRLAGYEYSEYWEESIDGEITALRGYNIGKNKLLLHNVIKISEELSQKLIRSRLFKGNVVFPCVGTIGNAIVIEENDKYHINQNIAKITPNDNLDPYFLMQYLISPMCKNEIKRFNATTSQPNVLVGSLRKFRIPFPSSINEQIKISRILGSVDEKLEILLEKKNHYQELKQGLMQQLLTGKIRVKV